MNVGLAMATQRIVGRARRSRSRAVLQCAHIVSVSLCYVKCSLLIFIGEVTWLNLHRRCKKLSSPTLPLCLPFHCLHRLIESPYASTESAENFEGHCWILHDHLLEVRWAQR
jgi:hypothetical protein